MTTLIYGAWYQVKRTLKTPSRLNVLLVLMLGLAGIGLYFAMRAAPQAITYPKRFLVSTPAAVCPGDTFTYPVTITVRDGDVVSRITEGWCREDGICPNALQAEPVSINSLEEQNFSRNATRTVPAELTPGEWQLRHCNETHSTGLIDVICYAVDVTVKECSTTPVP